MFASFEQSPQVDHRRALRLFHAGKREIEMTMFELDDADRWIFRLRGLAQRHTVHVIFVAHPAKMQRGRDGKYPFPSLYDISDSAHWGNKADIGVVVPRASLIEEKETTIRVVKSRYGSEIGVPGEITVVGDEGRTRFGEANGLKNQ